MTWRRLWNKDFETYLIHLQTPSRFHLYHLCILRYISKSITYVGNCRWPTRPGHLHPVEPHTSRLHIFMPRRKKVYTFVSGILVDEPFGTRCFYQSVLYKPGECEISVEVCFPLIYARPPPPACSEHHPSQLLTRTSLSVTQEARWHHYLDTGRVPPPETSPNPAGPHVPATGEGELAKSTVSPHDDGTAISGQVGQLNIDDHSTLSKMPVPLPGSNDGSEDGSGTRTMDRFLPRFPPLSMHFSLSAGASASHPSLFSIGAPSVSHHQRPRPRRVDNEKERKSKSGRRLRRLEKTVEALSHGLILALTQLKSESGGQSGTGHARAESHSVTHPGSGPLGEGRKAVSASNDATDALLTALSGVTLSEHCTESLCCVCCQRRLISSICSARQSR